MPERTTMPNLSALAEAGRLTQAGRLKEAMTLIQRGLGDGSIPQDSARLAVLPEKLRQALGGLRTIVPAFKPQPAQRETRGSGAPRPPQSDAKSFVSRSFANAAGSRDYKLYIPSGQTGPRPLVVMLHGCTQSPDDFAAGTRMNELAEERGFYVAYPGQSAGANAQKCWNWFQPSDQGRERGESGIIAGLVRALCAEHPIDAGRVYIAGLSAGGAAAANIARAYPDLFAAVGVHSGLAAACARDLSSALMAMRNGAPGSALPGTNFGADPAMQAPRLPTIVFHGDEDATVNRRNGEAVLAQAGIESLQKAEETSGSDAARPYTRTRYSDEAGRVQAEAWIVQGGGHAWSGGSPAGSYTDPQGPDASRAMLDFFEQHRLGEG